MVQAAPIGPAPDGAPLVVEVECRVGEGRPVRHPVVVGPDWAVEVPHDLAAERAAGALGGLRPCVGLVEQVAPALRDLVQLRGCRRVLPLGRNHAGRWVVTEPTAGCACTQESFGSAT